MKALSIIQPIAYLAGCLLGDAWLSSPSKTARYGYLCLRCKDQDFAKAFAEAITAGFSTPAKVTIDERGYYLVRKYNGGGRFAILGAYEPIGLEQKSAWLRGFFDSEGNVYLKLREERGQQSWARRILVTSTNDKTLFMVERLLRDLNIQYLRVPVKATAGHLGSKPVFNVDIRGGREHLLRFAHTVGTSIGRKRAAFDALESTYVIDIRAAQKSAQAKGAIERKLRARDRAAKALPIVVVEIRKIIHAGGSTSLRSCKSIPNYWKARLLHQHSEIVKMAREEEPCALYQ